MTTIILVESSKVFLGMFIVPWLAAARIVDRGEVWDACPPSFVGCAKLWVNLAALCSGGGCVAPQTKTSRRCGKRLDKTPSKTKRHGASPLDRLSIPPHFTMSIADFRRQLREIAPCVDPTIHSFIERCEELIDASLPLKDVRSAWKSPKSLLERSAKKLRIRKFEFYLAWMHYLGLGTPVDTDKAFALWKKVYERSQDPILMNLAGFIVKCCYAAGQCRSFNWCEVEMNTSEWTLGCEQVQLRCLQFCTLGAEQGDWFCQFLKAQCLLNGVGLQEPDFGSAFMILEGLALRGHAIAQCHLGEMIEDGLTPQPKDGPSMTWWYAQAAAQGYPEAQYALGRCHLMDDDRLDLAMFWFELAARNGHGDAIAML
ncbi:uncharacterized protein BJ171DRAFT_495752 [Polychytrium aggregatum]|uniref:uncharacterized protein n=1 Tax=Polychytrium aggregatum TaxID=110093 RepID=UPI0022FF0EC8|nr:uncharacterized protein BJ171DRAFT_495752 [Polychytrium aggregatum]KAI9206549.1 hypothetical protein BJ171DRAFT_495752 [Polychytrium aggregatum]